MIHPDLLFSVLCDDVRTEHNGKLILIGLFECIGAGGFPCSHPKLCIVNRWANGAGDFRQHTRLVRPDGEPLLEDREVEFSLPDLDSSHTVIAVFNNIVFPIPGRYGIEVYLNDSLERRCTLTLTMAESES